MVVNVKGRVFVVSVDLAFCLPPSPRDYLGNGKPAEQAVGFLGFCLADCRCRRLGLEGLVALDSLSG